MPVPCRYRTAVVPLRRLEPGSRDVLGNVARPALCGIEGGLDNAPPCGGILHLPQGPSLGSGLFCPGPSSLSRPHPPHSQAHRDFTARRLIRDAFAVRERLGDPRVVPSFRCTFLPDMPSYLTPGSSIIVTCPVSRCRRGLRRELTGSQLPTRSQSDSRGRPISWLHWFTTATAKARPGNAGVRLYGGATAHLDSLCARRR